MMWVSFRRASWLVVWLTFAPVSLAQISWTGGGAPDSSWSNSANWNSIAPGNGDTISFDANSTQNLATQNTLTELNLTGIVVGAVPGNAGANPISIGGNAFTLGIGGIDMSVASQPLTIALANNQSLNLGTSQTWKLGNGGVGSNQTLTVSSPITGDSSSHLSYGITNNSTGTSTSGTVRLLAANTYAGNTIVGGPNTTYEIGAESPFGTGIVNFNSFNTAPRIRTNGTRTIANAMTWNSGFMLTADSTGNLSLNGPIKFTGDVTGQTNRTINNVSTSLSVIVNGTVTMGDPDITPTVAGRNFILTTVVGGSIVINGILQDPTSATNTNVGTLIKNGTGPATVNNTASTYGGPTNLQNGILEVTLLADQGTPSSLGTGTNTATITLGNAGTTGTLRYIGSANSSTNRPLSLIGTTGGGTLDSSGAGTVTFTGNFAQGGAGSKTLTLTGTSNGANTISGIIRDNSAANRTAVVKTGPGAWILSGANTYTGTTIVNAGTLILGGTGNGAVATSASLAVTGGAVQFASDQSVKALDVQKANAGTQSLDLNNHALKILATDLTAAQNTLAAQLALSGTDGIYDSTAIGNTTVGYTIVSNTHVLAKKTLRGDATVDGLVDFNDLVALAQNYNTTGKLWPQGDFTGDGNVDFNDLVALAQNYNTSLPSEPIPRAAPGLARDLAAAFASVPEPSAAILCLISAGALSCKRSARRRKSVAGAAL